MVYHWRASLQRVVGSCILGSEVIVLDICGAAMVHLVIAGLLILLESYQGNVSFSGVTVLHGVLCFDPLFHILSLTSLHVSHFVIIFAARTTVEACSMQFTDSTNRSTNLPCVPDDNCSNTSKNCTGEDNGSQQARVIIPVLVGSGIGIISITALVVIPIAVVAGILKRKRNSLKQGRKKGEICTQ